MLAVFGYESVSEHGTGGLKHPVEASLGSEIE